MAEIVIPDLRELRMAHTVTFGSEGLCSFNPDLEDGYSVYPLKLFLRNSSGLFISFSMTVFYTLD